MTNKLKSAFQSSNQSPGFLLWRSYNQLNKSHRLVLRDLNLTPAQASILASVVYLKTDQDEVNQALIAQHTQMDKMFISDVVKTLIHKKLVLKSKSRTDARAFSLKPTASGINLCNKAIELIEKVDALFFANISDMSNFLNELRSLFLENELG